MYILIIIVALGTGGTHVEHIEFQDQFKCAHAKSAVDQSAQIPGLRKTTVCVAK